MTAAQAAVSAAQAGIAAAQAQLKNAREERARQEGGIVLQAGNHAGSAAKPGGAIG